MALKSVKLTTSSLLFSFFTNKCAVHEIYGQDGHAVRDL